MQLIVTVHVGQGDEGVARRMAVAAQASGVEPVVTQWVDPARTAFRAQFHLNDRSIREPLAVLAERFTLAAGPALLQLILVASTKVEGATVSEGPPPKNRTVVLPALRPDDEPGGTALVSKVEAPNAPTPREVAPVAPSSTLREVAPVARTRPAVAEGAPPVAFFVRAATQDGLHGILLDTGEELAVQPGTRWDVVDGEVLLFRPKKFWRFARSSLASGEFVSSRLEPRASGLPALRLFDRGGGRFELERVDLEGDPDDPADDPIVDAREALLAGNLPGSRQILRSALREDARCLDAHALLAETAGLRGDADQSARHDAVLLAFAREALPADFRGLLDPGLPGNRALYAALGRDHSRASAAARARLAPLVEEWRPFVAR